MPQPPSLEITSEELAETTPLAVQTPDPQRAATRAGAGSVALRAAAMLSVLYALSRLTGLVQLTVINSTLKPFEASAYQAAFTVPDFLYYLVAGGALSVTFIPILAQLEEEGREQEAERFFGALLGVMGGVLVLLLALCWVFARPLTILFNPGFLDAGKEGTLTLCVHMTRIMLPAQWFFYTGGLLVAVLNARKRFGATGWTGAAYNSVAIVVSLVLWFALGFVGPREGRQELAATGFAWGILFGAGAGYLVLPLVSFLKLPREQQLSLRPNLDWRQPAVKRFWINALPIMLGVSLPIVDVPIIKFFASRFQDEGSINYLMTSYRVMLAPLTIVAQAASVAAFPALAQNSAAADYQKLADFLRVGLRRLMFLTLPVSVILMLEATPIIRILFGYGEFARDHNAIPATASAFALFCLGLFAWAGQQLVARGFYALQDTRTPTIIGSLLTVGFIALCGVLQIWRDSGLALATSIGATAHFVGVLTFLDRKLRTPQYNAKLGSEKIAGVLLRTGVACLPMALVGWLVGRACYAVLPSSKWSDLGHMIIVGAVSLIVFGIAAEMFAIPEWKWVRAKVVRR